MMMEWQGDMSDYCVVDIPYKLRNGNTWAIRNYDKTGDEAQRYLLDVMTKDPIKYPKGKIEYYKNTSITQPIFRLSTVVYYAYADGHLKRLPYWRWALIEVTKQ